MPLPITLTSPLPATDLFFEAMSLEDGLSRLFELQLTLLSEKPDLNPETLLGQKVTVQMELPDGSKRPFNGHVTRFGLGPQRGRFHSYQATVRPWLWFATRRTNCRIYQDLNVQDIVKKVFQDHSIANFEFRLFRSYAVRPYCVQYRESDFAFVARLMEEEGIYWYFEHAAGQHKLVLVDAQSAHDAAPGCDSLIYVDDRRSAPPDSQYITDWSFASEVRSGKLMLMDYDFERPSSDLRVDVDKTRGHEQAAHEQFDYPGRYTDTAVGLQIAEDRLDEEQTPYETQRGKSNALGIEVGRLLALQDHPRGDQNIEYLVTHIALRARLDVFDATGGGSSFECDLHCIPSAQQFRPPRATRKPFVQGPQTAVVVGPGGEEIFTDKHGRVKVQFHWDRYGKKDETSSCWMRVSSAWAGKNFGTIHIPRIGQEVIVDFLEGDPDQPIVTGRVYNAEQMPPWELPANATQCGILSRSSKGGAYSNANALRFEDKKGSEQVWFHAEKNMDTSVENDQSLDVGHDQTVLIRHHQKVNVMKGREVSVEDEGETYYVKGLRKVFVKGHQVQTVTDGYDTIVTNERGEYTKGTRKSWTSADYIFKSTEAYFDVGPLLFVKGTDFKFKAGGAMFFEAGADFNAKAANFKFSSLGNFDFTGNKFNRTIFEGNDTVLGANTNTYIGVSRETAMGPATEIYSGMKNSAAAGIAIEGFLGMQVSNFLGLTMSNAVALSIENAAINMGMTGIDLTMSGISLDNNAIKLLNGGGAAGPGAAAFAGTGPGVVAVMAAALGGGFALGFGGAGTMDARTQGEQDVEKLLADPTLTPAVRARLQKALDSRFSNPTAEGYSGTISDGEIAAQTAKLAGDTPGATPANDPSSSLGPPAP